jgi:hypothetical protein
VWEEQIGDLPGVVLFLSAVTLGAFLLLSGGRLYLTERHLGWRRVSLLMGALACLLAPLSILLAFDSVDDDEVGLAIASAFAAFPLATLLVLGGKGIAGWVAIGFPPDAAGQSSKVTEGPRQANGLEPRGVRENHRHGRPARRPEGRLADMNDQAGSPEGAGLGSISMKATLAGVLLDFASVVILLLIVIAVAVVLNGVLGPMEYEGSVAVPSSDPGLPSGLLVYTIGLPLLGGVLWGLRRIRRRVYRYVK